VRSSSVEGEQEYAFWHALTRDVAYGRIPRAARARKHQTVAEWIESSAGDRASDHAELLAHHYVSALEIARAAGQSDTAELERQAARTLSMAGERALRLDSTRAYRYYQRALDLMEEDDPARPMVMIKTGQAMADAAIGSPLETYEEAAELALANDDRITAGHALRLVNMSRWFAFGTGAGTDKLDTAIELLEAEPASEQLTEAYITRAGNYMMSGDLNEQLAWSEKGIALARELDLDDIAGRGLSIRGIARFHLGDVESGMVDLRESLSIAEAEAATAHRLNTAFVNLADHTWLAVGPAAANEIYQSGVERVQARGADASWGKAEMMWPNWDLGDWDTVVATADGLVGQWGQESVQYVPWAKSYQAAVHVWRGEISEAVALQADYLPALREIGDLQLITSALVTAARTELAQGNAAAVEQLLDELIDVTEGKSPIYRGLHVTDSVRLLLAVGAKDKAEVLASASGAPGIRQEISLAAAQAMLAEAEGDNETALLMYEQVARDWVDYGYLLEHALALYGVGRCLAELGRLDEAADRLAEAKTLLAGLGALPTIEEIDGVAEQEVAL